ncbi:MAG: NAD(P)-binding domain-containing protein [Bacteriovoracaceae bacterium]
MNYEEQSLYDLVVVGAGPAGISLAVEAKSSGIDPEKVIILEKFESHSWSIRKFYPDDKLVTANYKGQDAKCEGSLCLVDSSKDGTLNYLDQAISDHSLNVRYNQNVDEIKKLNSGYYVVCSGKECFVTKVIALAIGVLGKPNRPSYPIPNDISSKVSFDVTSKFYSNKKILVVGGGDSASEYCQFLAERGNKVSISYRKKEFIRMNEINRKSIEKMIKKDKVSGLLGTDIERLEKSETGGVNVIFNSKETRSYDEIVYALGGSSPKDFLKAIGIKVSKDGPDMTNELESEQRQGIFLVGDISAGSKGGSINVAFNTAHQAMKEFCRSYLDCSKSL